MVGSSIIYMSFSVNIYNLQNTASVNLNVKCTLSVDTSTKRLCKAEKITMSICHSVFRISASQCTLWKRTNSLVLLQGLSQSQTYIYICVCACACGFVCRHVCIKGNFEMKAKLKSSFSKDCEARFLF